MLRVVKNTFPEYNGIAHANPGDIVEWRAKSSNESGLYRVKDTGTFAKCLWTRTRSNRMVKFKQPPVGVIFENKTKGWQLIIEKIDSQ
jgi:hypothetical protein